ncbi:Glu-tRNA(Gln) amidotransferase subunit GatE [Candidatus Bathyarchaeota archaeon]|nr:Glu-tRNA(Gln) amidotransferase subunit GatE [Candidatus Bathyarchaeota archaeon]NIU81155.1 Glu-tRNA(Gln) amidotransferase subunit GatE [Candidatus Bathyarchaeota archaeon]NIV67781.1 Glu-tRNA(Gln) amidotransferase subunit GatE [Candidatus Bathyarchaeota archaeon]NIW16275.1 Glu-tRNA(Gln) amidotransferase subunit GatE [Candidatus Bathyarchaeota archaeon]NIW34393.1 Glu-tRNA(Gln) amidotransferase subunit GatE [Candidatus Bathyarchaeota archaeon]
MKIDYDKVGLKVGLEVHQQLDTETKLFCSCKPELLKGEPEITFERRLRPTQSELGQIDPAALFEFQKGIKILYETTPDTACLVEMDEEPPHDLDREAVEISITVALMMKAQPVDEIHVMRKTVIDGSNTTGFQRTCVIAIGGELIVKGKKIPIEHISLEEDAARKTGGEDSLIRYRIDRLGIPLIEIATAPVLNTPEEAENTALAIGRILRATGRVRRGIGTIRQDLNISIPAGALVEVKGVQELGLVSEIIENEVQRQINLLTLKDELLKKRGVKVDSIKDDFVDVTSIFEETSSRVVRKAIEQEKEVLAVRLPGFAGLLKRQLAPGMWLGREMADIASFWGRVGGLFHTDELPDYGIAPHEVDSVRRLTESEEPDAVVFVADTPENATDALKAVTNRARKALKGVPEETRAANPDGTTRYMRPRPGAARMYPETDVPPIQLSESYLKKLHANLPEMPAKKMERLMRDYDLNRKLARQILRSKYRTLFEEVVQEMEVSPTTAAVALTETLKALRRDSVPVRNIKNEQLRELFGLLSSGETTKEAIPDVMTWLSTHEETSAKEAVEELGLGMLSEKDLSTIVEESVKENKALVEERGMAAFGSLMGIVMKRVRGQARAESVSTILKRHLARSAD